MAAAPASPAESEAAAILDASGVRAGLAVHIGARNGRLAAALGASGRFLVCVLAADDSVVEAVRSIVRERSLDSRVSVSRRPDGALPYVDNLVNLLIVEEGGSAAHDVIMRVLVPEGVAHLKQEGGWTQPTKPRPPEIDEWPLLP
jgi:hypothetical protein